MKVINGLNQIKKYRRPVIALGVFDGVHVGHQKILKAAADKARAIKGTSIVITFWPHPQKEESLISLEHRLRLIKELGINVCIVLNFSQKFSAISADDFIKNILAKKLGVNYLYVGRNFRFGRGARGDFRLLQKLSLSYCFRLELFPVVKINRQPVSSTQIRALIKKGKLKAAERLLGRPVGIFGTIIKGAAVARVLGFPTANIDPHHEVIPPSGVYAVKVVFNNKNFSGVCNIGTQPTFMRTGERHIEVHIFNFHRNIYGKNLELQFLRKIRNERKFTSTALLIREIKKDVSLAKAITSRH